MPIYRARVTVDLLYQADEPLSAPLLTRISNRTGTYLRTGAAEGLEDIEVNFQEELRSQHAHHHDAREERCRACLRLSTDHLGHVE